MKILLINPITRAKNVKLDRSGVNYPMGIGYIGAYLEQAGHQVTILDNNQRCYDKFRLKTYLENIDVDIIGITSMANTYNQVLQLCRLIKETTNLPIMMGGALPTYSSRVVLENFDVDVCVLGEGEETVAELIDCWPNFSDVNGIAYRNNNGEYIKTPLRMPEKSRDDYPYPGYDGLIDITKYWRGALQTWENHVKDERIMGAVNELNKNRSLKIGTMLSGMGCPYKCTFCTNSTPFMKTRERSPESVAKEAMHLKERFGVNAIRFDDDLLILQKQRTLEIARAMKKTGLFWSGQAVGRSVTDEDVIKELADSNCVGFGIGIESGSDRLLKAMMKGSRTIHYKKAFELVKKYGLGIRVQLIYGVTGEDKSTLTDTINFFKESQMPPRRFNKLFPMPGSGIYDQCVEQGIIFDEHAYLNSSSQVSGYTSRSFDFNITKMSDEEYRDNLLWAENEMRNNYSRGLYRDVRFWLNKLKFIVQPNKLLHYGIKIISIVPVFKKLAYIWRRLVNRGLNRYLLEKNIVAQNENTMNEVTTLFPEMLPDRNRPGFVNRPLVDERVEQIMQDYKSKDRQVDSSRAVHPQTVHNAL